MPFWFVKLSEALPVKIKVNYSYEQVTNLMLKTWVKSRIKQICCKLVLPLSYGKNAVYPTMSDFDRELLVCLCLCHRKLLIHVFGTDSLGFVCPCLCLSKGFPGLFLGPFTCNKKSSIFSQITILFSQSSVHNFENQNIFCWYLKCNFNNLSFSLFFYYWA